MVKYRQSNRDSIKGFKILENIARKKEVSKAILHGQTHAENFYNKLGYQRKSEMFMEKGIPHFLMEKSL